MSDSNVYTAERILAKRVYKGVTQYHIKWQGYSADESTWEPVENIIDRGLLTAFEKKVNKKTKRSSSSSASKRKIAKNFDNRENSIDNSAATSSKNNIIISNTTNNNNNNININSTTTSASLMLDQANNITSSPIANSNITITKSPTVKTSTSASTSPIISRTPPITINVSPKVSTSPSPSPPPLPTPPTSQIPMVISPIAPKQIPSPNNHRSAAYSSPSPHAIVSSPKVTPHTTPTKVTEVQVEPALLESIEEITVQRINSSSSPPPRISSTPRLSSTPKNNFIILPQDNNNSSVSIIKNNGNNITNNINNNNSPKNRRLASRFAILNTVITDVTVNDQTITISESKTNQGFFKEVSRHSVSVECTTNHANSNNNTSNINDNVDMVD